MITKDEFYTNWSMKRQAYLDMLTEKRKNAIAKAIPEVVDKLRGAMSAGNSTTITYIFALGTDGHAVEAVAKYFRDAGFNVSSSIASITAPASLTFAWPDIVYQNPSTRTMPPAPYK